MLKMRLLLLVLMLFVVADVWGQIEENPFDLDLEPTAEEVANQPAQSESNNPFDLDLPGAEGLQETPSDSVKETVVEAPTEAEVDTSTVEMPEPSPSDTSSAEIEPLTILPNNPFDLPEEGEEIVVPTPEIKADKDKNALVLPEMNIPVGENPHGLSQLGRGIFLLFLGILLAILNSMFRSDLQRVWRTFGSLNQANFNYRQLAGSFRWSALFFFLFFFLTGGLFLFYLLSFFGVQLSVGGWAAVAVLVGALVVITLGRMLVLGLIRGIFPFGQEIGFFQFNITQFNFVIGLVLFPMVIALAFVQEQLHQIILWIAIFAVAGIYVFRTIRGLFIARQYLMFHKFHFFLYLCTVEIAPLVILLKLVTNWSSVS